MRAGQVGGASESTSRPEWPGCPAPEPEIEESAESGEGEGGEAPSSLSPVFLVQGNGGTRRKVSLRQRHLAQAHLWLKKG